jgi:hypothetical protein
LEKRFLNENGMPVVGGDNDKEIDVVNFVPKTRAEVMALQQAILSTEDMLGKIKFENENEGDRSAARLYRKISQGRTVNRLSGSSLCNGFCTVSKAVDGIYGSRTKKAFEDYKNNNDFKEFLKTELHDVEKEYSPSVNDWQIPATEDLIKAFQYFVWKVLEDDLVATNKGCSGLDDCLYKSILCGGNACLRSKAVDGRWGTNTKKAWNEHKDKFLKTWGFYFTYDYVFNAYNGNQAAVDSAKKELGL